MTQAQRVLQPPSLGAGSSGILVVDKPSGPTSHDIVARVRRAFRPTAVGHAGTLDPAASGVLVVLVGEATKLGPYASGHDKSYEAEVEFGRSTTTLDAEGTTERETPIPDDLVRELDSVASALHGRVAAALEAERCRTAQVPPAFSAIKQGGRPVYERARRGQAVMLAPRPVAVRSISVVRSGGNRLVVQLTVAKGYYVRSFARDIGETLGVPAHLTRLRRLGSGPFTLGETVQLPTTDETLVAALIPLARAVQRVLPIAFLTERGLVSTRHGRTLLADDFVSPPPTVGHSAWLGPQGQVAAVGRFEPSKDAFVVERGFCQDMPVQP